MTESKTIAMLLAALAGDELDITSMAHRAREAIEAAE